MALFVVLPVATIMALAGAAFHVYHERVEQRTAQAKLQSASQLTARLIQRRIERIDGALESVLLQESLYDFAMFERAGLLDDAAVSRAEVESALLRLTRGDPHVATIDLYRPSGERFVAIDQKVRSLVPQNVSQEPWFHAALRRPRMAELVGQGQLRLSLVQFDDQHDPIAVASLRYDLRDGLHESSHFATEYMQSTEVVVRNQQGEALFQHGEVTEEQVMEAKSSLALLGATVVVRQARSEALATFYSAQRLLFGALGIVTLGLMAAAGLGTHLVVRDLRRAQRKADEANRAKSEFLANMSHEIRTPMNGVLGMAELLSHTRLSGEQREYLSMIQQSADSLLRILNDILDFSKIEAGRLELESVAFRLRDCVGKAVQSLTLRAAAKEIELACRIAPDLPDGLRGDPVRLRQILINLVGNSIKFTSQGEVVVDVERDGEPENGQTVRLHVTVRDTGIGIPPEKQQYVFDAFAQADSSTTRRFGGTGLGLTISSQLVRMMGGRIWLQSEVNKGTTFHFTAEFLLDDAPIETPRVQPPSLAGQSVLVVDDNATNRRILQELLKSWRMLPVLADGGPAALAELRRAAQVGRPYGLVLLDLMMPDMDGFDLAAEIRRADELQEPRMIMLSSVARPGDAQRCRDLGLAGYLTKPLVCSELLDTLLSVDRNSESGDGRPTEAPPTSAVFPRKILLVEDGLVNQRVAVGLLTRQGHQVTLAVNGQEAIEAWEREPFDLVLMDLQMPVMDGFAATARIRELEHNTGRRTPIIAMTAAAMKGDRERCLQAGMDGHLAKPVRADEMARAIEVFAPVRQPLATHKPSAPPRPQASVAHGGSKWSWEAAVQRIGGGPEEVTQMAQVLLEECPKLLRQIDEARATGNVVRLQRAAHTLKSSVDVFAAQAAFDAAWRLEKLSGAGDRSEIDQAIADVKREVSAFTSSLEQVVSTQPAS